ncbi:MAG TPA: GNAT family N-acetyltransferase [Flexivirga sp.]|uniref:GNAT family N-acetyltransferase n=1 Tax=Flexivirga sp. TaxID=1962927 RepID=UPI002CEAED76|nr:GNAT family N-acetyltransferase [Flexivirga sp.]HWC23491.1 GNAT family N-acetyltransferase [Flexivirga sp.]
MRVRPITDDELPDYISTSMRGYAKDKHVNGGIPREQADAEAARETELYFPGGRLTPGHAVLIAEDDNGERVGDLWMAPRTERQDVAFIYAIQVEPSARGNGYGRALMQEAAQWSRDNGFRTLALHVFGGNDIAINLYESLGFVTTDRMMKLDL